jgi:SAM-dependent methyltransferase
MANKGTGRTSPKARATAPSTPPTVETVVKDYLSPLGPGQNFRTRKAFEQWIIQRHGDAGRAFMNHDGNRETVYELKNHSLKLGLDVMLGHSFHLYKNYLEWFLREFPSLSPARIIDLGCDNGLMTCFYAKTFPNADVVGIDRSARGIACARELAAKLNVPNVRFDVAHLDDPSSLPASTQYDLVIGTTVFMETIGLPFENQDAWSVSDFAATHANNVSEPIINSVARLLIPRTGYLISLERLPNSKALCWWGSVLKQAGIQVDWHRSCFLEFEEVAQKQSMPIVVGQNLEKAVQFSPSDVLAFWSYRQFEGLSHVVYTESAAEALFEEINPKTLVRGGQLVWANGSGIQRCELWTAGALALVYNSTNKGYSDLRIHSKTVIKELLELLDTELEQMEENGPVTPYMTLEARDASS